MGRNYTHWTEEEMAKLFRLRAEGRSFQEISEVLDKSYTACYAAYRRNGGERTSREIDYTKVHRDIAKKYLVPETYEELYHIIGMFVTNQAITHHDVEFKDVVQTIIDKLQERIVKHNENTH